MTSYLSKLPSAAQRYFFKQEEEVISQHQRQISSKTVTLKQCLQNIKHSQLQDSLLFEKSISKKNDFIHKTVYFLVDGLNNFLKKLL